jgi:membrane-associated phospholipid phosphatase
MGLALIAYVVFPTAPPRLMPEWGFADPVAGLAGVEASSSVTDVLVNPFAAVPSMHVAFALMLGLPMAQMVRRSWARWLWLGYPVLVSAVVVVTANHWWTDAFLGACVAAVAGWFAWGLVRVQPHAWAFQIPARGAAI